MKRMKKLLAALLTLTMVLGMTVTAFAAPEDSTKPVPTDTAKITVSDVKTGATVKAFKVAKGLWNDNGFYGYEALVIDGKTIADLENPTVSEVMDLANAVDKNDGVKLDDNKNDTYTKTLEVGLYLILVTANAADDDTIYNPMIVSVYYNVAGSGSNNVVIGGTVSAGDDYVVEGQDAYAKSETIDIDKKIVNPGSGNVKGDDTAIGDDITFEIKTNFPNYNEEYTEVEFNIIDTLSEGLTLHSDTVTVDGAVKDTDYTVSVAGQTMTIEFTSDYILKHKGEEVVVNYTAELNDNAGLNFDANTNTVHAEYTNNPTTKDKGKTEEKKTYHYTFGIDAKLYGEDSEVWNKFTKELLKTGEEREIKLESGETTTTTLLPGAEFTLTSTDRADKKAYTTTSGEDGTLVFEGLDAGSYILQETKAPDGYSLNNAEISVVITAEYNDDGTLKSYKIEVNNKETSTYTATYSTTDKGRVTNIEVGNTNDWSDVSETHEIMNTKLSELPSTGGIGTTIFTIAGCLIMIAAAGLFFFSRRKAAK